MPIHLRHLLCAVLACLVGQASAQIDRSYFVIARQKEPTPSAGAGASHGIISSNPVIGAAGHVAFAGFVSGGDGGFAVWSGLPGSVQKLAITNDPAPGRPLDRLDIFGVTEIRANPDGSTAFRAGLVDSDDSGIWIGTPGSIEEVAIVNNQVVGLPAGTLYEDFPRFTYVCNGDGAVAIRATVSTGAETVLLSGQPDSLGLVARQRDPLPDHPAIRYDNLSFIGLSMNANGQLLANVPLDTGDLNNDHALMAGSPGDFNILFQEGDAIDGIPGATFDAFAKPRIANDGGLIFTDDPRGIEIGRTLFYYRPDDGLHALATDGEVAAGAPGSTYAGLFFTDPAVSSNGWVAFRAGLDPDSNSDRDGVWVAHRGVVELVAKKGDPAIGLPGATFTDFSAPVINDRGVVAFTANTTGAAGIWIWDRGTVRLVLTRFDQIPTPGADEPVGVVRNFYMKAGTGSQDGQGSCLNDACQLAVRVGFQIQIGPAIVVIPDLCDLDGDGIECFLEDASGADCNDPDDGAESIPQVHLEGGEVVIVYRRLQAPSNFTYEVECSTDLADWQPVAQSATLAPDQAGLPPGVERVQVAVPPGLSPRKLLRVRVTRNQP